MNGHRINAQFIPISNSYEPLYEFLEELKANNLSHLSLFNGPVSEKQFMDLLDEAVRSNNNLSFRLKNEIGHYQREFQIATKANRGDENDLDIFRKGNSSLSIHPLGYFWGDKYNSLKIQPVGGFEWTLNDNGNNLYYHKGARVSGHFGHFAYYGKIHDQTHTEIAYRPMYLNSVHTYSKSAKFSDMLSGGISFSNSWMMLGVFHDKMHLGSSLTNPIYISHKSPTYNQLRVTLNPSAWFAYRFVLAGLGSMADNSFVLPVSQENALLEGSKGMALNQISFYPIPSIELSFGQLTTFAREKSAWYNYIPLNYYGEKEGFDPLIYYHLALSSIPHVDISFTHFFEHFSSEALTYKEPKNQAGMQGRFVLSNWPIPDVTFRTEYTYVSPFALNTDPVSFQHDSYPLGWYLGDHSDRFYFSATAKPVHNLQMIISYEKSRVGDYEQIDASTPRSFTSFQSFHWKETTLGFQFRHQTSYYTQLFAGIYRINREGDNETYRTAPIHKNQSYAFKVGINIGY